MEKKSLFEDFIVINKLDKNLPYSFDNFLKNEFEAMLYYELSDAERNWYFGGRVQFISIFNQLVQFNEELSASKNLNNILAYVEKSHSKIEIIYYLEKVCQWINWKEKIGEINSIGKARKLFYLIKIYIDYLQNDYSTKNEIREEQIAIANKKTNEEKLNEIKKIVNFLKPTNEENIYLSNEDFDFLMNFITKLIHDGDKFDIEKKLIKFNSDNLTKADIIHTFYLVNHILYGRTRNTMIFKFIALNIFGFENDRQFFIDRDSKKPIPQTQIKLNLNNLNTYKNFSNPPSSNYAIINPPSKDIN